MKTAILFDLDGTLLDTLGDLHAAVNYALTTFGYAERTAREIRRFVGGGMRNLVRCALPEGTEESRVDEVLAVYHPYYDSHNLILTKPYDGIMPALEVLKKHYSVGIVSNKQDTAVKPLCENFFGADVYAQGETPECPRKPAPNIILKAMEKLGVDNAIYVGDSEVDLQAAKNAGLPCLLVTWGFRDRQDLEKTGGIYFCDDPTRLVQTLEEMVNAFYGK